MQKLLLSWKCPFSNETFIVGLLTYKDNQYRFFYTKGAKRALEKTNFNLLHSFPVIDRVYKTNTVFPFFANRLMPSSRPDYVTFLEWLDLSPDKANLMDILVRSGAKKVTDTFEIQPCPEPNSDGFFEIYFFANMPEEDIKNVVPGDKINLDTLNIIVNVEKINLPPAPSEFRVLCKLITRYNPIFNKDCQIIVE
jgi:hypothetical protein